MGEDYQARPPRRGARLVGLLAQAIEALFPPDPGLLRRRQAARATIAAVITLAVVKLFGTYESIAAPATIFGFATALFMIAALHDPSPKKQRVTILLCIASAWLASLLGAVLLRVPWLAEAGFCLVLAATVYASSLGPRQATLMTVAMIAYIIGLVGHIGMADLPRRALIAAIAAMAALFCHSVLLPEQPARVLTRIDADVRRRVRGILAQLAQAVRAGYWQRGARRRLRHVMARLDEAVVVAETTLAGPGLGRAQVRHMAALDLATERVAWKLLAGLPPPAERRAVAAALESLRERPCDGLPATGAGLGDLAAALGGLAAALGGLAAVAAGAGSRERGLSDTELPGPPPGDASGAARAEGLRHAAQAAMATALAIVIGQAISGRWYWAAFAAYVVFLGTHSSGESLAKALQFMCGTIAGVLAGALIATALSAHPYSALAGIVIAVFLAFHAGTAAYGVMMFWITIILGLLFALLGYFPSQVLLLRLEETAIGAACGVAVAFAVLRMPTRDRVAMAERAYLAAIGALIGSTARCFACGVPEPELAGHTFVAEQRFEELRVAARPATHGLLAGPSAGPRRRMWLLMVCQYRVRRLAELAEAEIGRVGEATAAAICGVAQRIEERIAAYCATPPPPSSGGGPGAGGREGPVMNEGEAGRRLRLLQSIDRDLRKARV